MNTAIITGAFGQDASYLAEFLLEKDYKVIAIYRRTSSCDKTNIEHLLGNKNYHLEQGDITDFGSISRVVQTHKPTEFYNLAAQSFVGASWDQASVTCSVNFVGVCNCLEALKLNAPNCKFFQASTSEVYGDVITPTQSENTLARPRSPYAASKYGAESLVKVYRDSYRMFTCYARSFNHESPRRGKEFVTRKITNWLGSSFRIVEENLFDLLEKINPNYKKDYGILSSNIGFAMSLENGLIEKLHLGNLDVYRDWTHAKDIVRGMWMMLQQNEPDDYVLASGKTRSIRDFLASAFAVIGISDWENYIEIDQKFYRPADVAVLCGDYTKAKEKLNWQPEISFDSLVNEMVNSDIDN